jgi:hypothetical protein
MCFDQLRSAHLQVALLLLVTGLVALSLPTSASAGVSFSGQFSSNGPLLIVPHDDAQTVTVDGSAPVFFIQRMPVTKTISTITLGDFGRGSCSSSTPLVRLFISDRPSHDLSGSATQVAYTTEVPLPITPRRLTWTFEWTSSGSALVLQAGHTYNFELSLSGCSSFKQTTWAPADPLLETPATKCISGLPFQTSTSGPRRQWHDASTTPASTCVNFPGNWATAWWPYEPDGWLVSINPGAPSYIAAIQNIPSNAGTSPSQPCGEPNWANQGITQVNVVAPTGAGGDPQTDGICTWDHYHPPGQETDYGWSTALPLRSEFDAAPRLPYVGLGVTPEVAFRPILLFDEGEKWRPLNIDALLNERDPIHGDPVQCVGATRGTCTPAEGLATLRQHYAPSDRIILGAWDGSDPDSPDDYQTMNTPCALTPPGANHFLQDCDTGATASIYYNALTRSAGYNYYDYWFFYRYNELPGGNHEADWEHVTIAQSLTDPATFDWVQFFQHNGANGYSAQAGLSGTYLRTVLSCDNGGVGSCGSDPIGGADDTRHGQRVRIMVAAGSHASYPTVCSNLCFQENSVVYEGDHGGEVPWGANDDLGALLAFPNPAGWLIPGQANWTDWPGRWGQEGAPESPGSKTQFKCPWNGNPADATACTARSRTMARAAAITSASSRCADWYGNSVIAAACTPSVLKPAVDQGQVGDRGQLRIAVDGQGRRSASARGIAQAVGTALHPGSTITVRGRLGQDTELMVRAVYGRRVRKWVLQDFDRSRRKLTIKLPADQHGRPQITYN